MIPLLRRERSRLWHLCGARPFTATVIGHNEAKEAQLYLRGKGFVLKQITTTPKINGWKMIHVLLKWFLFRGHSFIFGWQWSYVAMPALPETYILAPENRPPQKERIIFQPQIFRGEVILVSGRGPHKSRPTPEN